MGGGGSCAFRRFGMAERTAVSGMSTAPTLCLTGLPRYTCPTAEGSPNPEGATEGTTDIALMPSGTLLVFSLLFWPFFASESQMWGSGSLRAGAPCGHMLVRKPLRGQHHGHLIALSPCFGVRNPGLYLLSDHIFCFAADRVTTKRPQSSLFFMQASTGYVDDGPAPPSGAGSSSPALPQQRRPVSVEKR